MKIAIIGSQCTGKTTYIQDFLKNWPTYKLCPKPRYSELIKEKNLKLNEDGTEESQRIILNSLADQVIYTPKTENTIFDRSVLDNLVYTMWLNEKGKVSDAFVRETIKIVKETLVFYDILFFLPISKQSPIPFELGENRSNDPTYREEIDNIFKALVMQYSIGDKTYFPFDHELGSPAVIDIFGNREERIALTKMYIQEDGSAYSEKDTLLTIDSEPDPEKPHILEF
jgi:GTPase SAR1 family protein